MIKKIAVPFCPALIHFFLLVFMLLSISSLAQVDVEKINWIHGSADCSQNKDPFAQVIQYDSDTYIIRQNKCLNYEAPFIYLFIGNESALLMDTGASTDLSFPLYGLVAEILGKRKSESGKSISLKVIHSHGHGDHTANDNQFLNRPGVELIKADKESMLDFFQFKNWPNETVHVDLGHRKLTIIPMPGHDNISIAIYDPNTKWLLTGDTVYPGRLYIRDWPAFKNSIDRLILFCKTNEVSYLMGNHIEMTNTPGVDYATGTLYQPKEHPLPLKTSVLSEIQIASKNKSTTPKREVHDDFIIEAR